MNSKDLQQRGGSMIEGEAPAAKKLRGKRTKVQGVFHATAARHRMAWGSEKGPQTEKEKQATKRMDAELSAAEDQIATIAQELEREFTVGSSARDSRLEQRLKVDASARGKQRFRQSVDGSRSTRVLGYYDGTPWLLVRDEQERREFFYNPGAGEATWDEPPELQAEKHTGSTDGERDNAAKRAVSTITRSMAGRTKQRRQVLKAYASCIGKLSGGYPDYVNQKLCFVEDLITAGMLALVAALSYMRSAGIANIWVGAGVQTSRERHGDDWHGGSDAVKGSSGIPIDLIILILICGSKCLLCLGPQDGGAQAVAQICCTIKFEPLPGHARQLQQLFQAVVFCLFGVFSLGLPFWCFLWTFIYSLWLVLAGYFKFDPIWIVAGYAAQKEIAWLIPPPRFCKPMAKNLASIQYGVGGAWIVWAAVDGERGELRPPTRTSIRCSCLHRRAAEASDVYAMGGMPMPEGLLGDLVEDGEEERGSGDEENPPEPMLLQNGEGEEQEQLQDVDGSGDEAEASEDTGDKAADDETPGYGGEYKSPYSQ